MAGKISSLKLLVVIPDRAVESRETMLETAQSFERVALASDRQQTHAAPSKLV